MHDFKLVGEIVPFGETLVGATEVAPIRELAEIDLFLSARSRVTDVQDGMERSRYTLLFQTHDIEFDSHSHHLSVATSYQRTLGLWRLLIRSHDFRASSRHSNKITHYQFEGQGDDVMRAVKQVHFVLGSSQIVVDQTHGPMELVSTRRRKFERSMEPGDCESLLAMLANGVRRARVA